MKALELSMLKEWEKRKVSVDICNGIEIYETCYILLALNSSACIQIVKLV